MAPHREIGVPAGPGELTARWLTAALAGSFAGGVVESVRCTRTGEAFGLASEIYRCRLDGAGVPPSVVVKLWPLDGKAGAREVHFYERFGDRVGARIPRGHFGALDPERGRGVLVLEDIYLAEQGDDRTQLGLDRAAAVARELARVHARWWGASELAREPWLRSLSHWDRDEVWFAPRRARFLERFPGRLDPLALKLLKRIQLAPARFNARLSDAPETLIHADFHLDNLLFERPDGAPVILDWAGVSRAPAVLDLANLLFGIGRIEHVDTLLTRYHDALRAGGVVIDRSTLEYWLGGAILRRFALGTCGVARWEPKSPREEAMIDGGIERVMRMVRFWRDRDPELFAL